MGVLECSSPQSEASGGVPVGKDTVFLKCGQWEFDLASLSICVTQIGLRFSLFGGRGGWTWEDRELSVIRGHDVKFLNNH